LGVLSLAACSGEPGESEAGSVAQPIVRATSEGGPDGVVLLYVTVFDGLTGGTYTRSCTGSYFASRVVVTAAHCLDADPEQAESVMQVLTYFGDDFAGDLAQLPPPAPTYQVPAPGTPSPWAGADSFEVHPDWDRQLMYPDVGVVYLDRELPVEPLPLARFPLGQSYFGRPVTISGWGANVATGPTTATGGRVQRSGTTRLLGSPTAADYHPEDPNPGMLDASVRSNVIKTDGTAPYSNACFGDSGGPVLVTHGARQYIAGIEYFGGLYCEDYSLFTRTSSVLGFLDAAVQKAGKSRLSPELECVAPNADGSFTAFFGYDNDNQVSIDVPWGVHNSLPLDTQGVRPTHFLPGEHAFVFGVDFQPDQTLRYRLSAKHGPSKVLRVDARSRECSPEQATQLACGQSCRGQLRSGCTGLQGYAACIEGCVGFYDIFRDVAPQCLTHMDAWNGCLASTPPGPESWQCFPESSPGAGDGFADAPACTPFIDEFFMCLDG
jgi:hypothetical protein